MVEIILIAPDFEILFNGLFSKFFYNCKLQFSVYRKSTNFTNMSCFNEEIFCDNEEIMDGLICPIGLGILNNPVNDPCGHTFCEGCINRSLSYNEQCPLSKDYLNSKQIC